MTVDLTRRRLLGSAAAAGLGIAAACTDDGSERGSAGRPGPTSGPSTSAGPAPAAQDRMLVVVELAGGNDGLSTLVPFGDPTYRKLRPTLALGEEQVVPIDDRLGLNAQLAPLADQGLAVLDGIGVGDPSLSHFDMIDRWWTGGRHGAADRTGFLGRLCDRLGPGTMTGLSVGRLPTPAVVSASGSTTTRPGGDPVERSQGISDAAWAAIRAAWSGPGAAETDGSTDDLRETIRGLAGRAVAEDDELARVTGPTGSYPGDDDQIATFGRQLQWASQVLRSDLGVRVVHVAVGGVNFDTHDEHAAQHRRALDVMVPNLVAFRDDLAAAGLAERVLIATTSEFGRRPEEHNGGLDHGTASCALLMRPGLDGVHGEPPSLRRLDRDGNLRSTVRLGDYYATLAAWLGVDPSSVLEGRSRPIDPLLT